LNRLAKFLARRGDVLPVRSTACGGVTLSPPQARSLTTAEPPARIGRIAPLLTAVLILGTAPAQVEAQDSDPMGWGVPRWVERGRRGYLRCGIPAYGFARLRCMDCRILAFSCKGRGVWRLARP